MEELHHRTGTSLQVSSGAVVSGCRCHRRLRFSGSSDARALDCRKRGFVEDESVYPEEAVMLKRSIGEDAVGLDI